MPFSPWMVMFQAVLAACLCACAPQEPAKRLVGVNARALAALAPKTIAQATNPTNDLFFRDFDKIVVSALISPIGGAAWSHSHSQRLAKDFGVIDPANEIGKLLTAEFSKHHKITLQPSQELYAEREIRNHWKADLVLDVRTTTFMLDFYGSDPNRHRFNYEAQLELYDVRNQKAVAWGDCVVPTRDVKHARTYKELMANNAELLKAEYRDLIDYCVRTFSSYVLRI